MLADFKANFFVSQVRLGTKPALTESFFHFQGKIGLFVGDIHHHRLSRCQPGGECTLVVLDQNPDKALEGTENRAVQHHRMLTAVVLADVFGTQTHRQVEIELQGTTLPDPTQAILQGEFDLRPVERTLTRLQVIRQPGTVQRGSQGRLGAIPQIIGAHTLVRTGRELELDIGKAEVGIDRQGQLDEISGFGLHLLFGTEDMRIVLSEAAHAHDAVQRAGRLVTVTSTELGQTHWQLAIALQTLIEYLHVARAVHRLDRVVAALRLSGEHVFGVVGPVPGFLPQ